MRIRRTLLRRSSLVLAIVSLFALSLPGVRLAEAGSSDAPVCQAGESPDPVEINAMVEQIREHAALVAAAKAAKGDGAPPAVYTLNGKGYNYESGPALELDAYLELQRDAALRAKGAAAPASR